VNLLSGEAGYLPPTAAGDSRGLGKAIDLKYFIDFIMKRATLNCRCSIYHPLDNEEHDKVEYKMNMHRHSTFSSIY